MTSNARNPEQQSNPEAPAEVVPAFKPVALPALAAAMRSAQAKPRQSKEKDLPAILRKEAVLGH